MYDIIVDAGKSRAHGNREMPVWGKRYALEQIAEEGEFGNGGSDANATVITRVLELVFYLATIQK